MHTNLCLSATELLKLVYTPLNVPFLKTLVLNLSFSLQILISRKEKELSFSVSNENLITSVFRKDTFSGVYTNLAWLSGLHRSFTIVSDFFHFEVETLKKTLHKDAYHKKFVDKCIAEFVTDICSKTCFYHRSKLEL